MNGGSPAREIPLTQGKFALVDADDYEDLSKYKWCFDGKYARRNLPRSFGAGKHIRMHQVILPAPEGLVVDHISGNKLDNRKENLRIITNQQNQFNLHSSKSTISEYKGASWDSEKHLWRARIKVNYKTIHLGYFEDPRDAAAAYNCEALKYFGEHAALNPVPTDPNWKEKISTKKGRQEKGFTHVRKSSRTT